MRRLTSCGSRGSRPNPAVHRRSVPNFGIRRHLAQCCLGRFQLRFAVVASTDVAGASRSLGLRDGAWLHRGARWWCGDGASPREASEPVLSLTSCW
jgi:hypothetical protein